MRVPAAPSHCVAYFLRPFLIFARTEGHANAAAPTTINSAVGFSGESTHPFNCAAAVPQTPTRNTASNNRQDFWFLMMLHSPNNVLKSALLVSAA
jgi:hypothetical protein